MSSVEYSSYCSRFSMLELLLYLFDWCDLPTKLWTCPPEFSCSRYISVGYPRFTRRNETNFRQRNVPDCPIEKSSKPILHQSHPIRAVLKEAPTLYIYIYIKWCSLPCGRLDFRYIPKNVHTILFRHVCFVYVALYPTNYIHVKVKNHTILRFVLTDLVFALRLYGSIIKASIYQAVRRLTAKSHKVLQPRN